jgi:hypothetical protein
VNIVGNGRDREVRASELTACALAERISPQRSMTQHENPQQGFIRADCGRPARFPDFGGDDQADESEDESAPIIDSCVKITILLVCRYFAIAWSDGYLIDWT